MAMRIGSMSASCGACVDGLTGAQPLVPAHHDLVARGQAVQHLHAVTGGLADLDRPRFGGVFDNDEDHPASAAALHQRILWHRDHLPGGAGRNFQDQRCTNRDKQGIDRTCIEREPDGPRPCRYRFDRQNDPHLCGCLIAIADAHGDLGARRETLHELHGDISLDLKPLDVQQFGNRLAQVHVLPGLRHALDHDTCERGKDHGVFEIVLDTRHPGFCRTHRRRSDRKASARLRDLLNPVVEYTLLERRRSLQPLLTCKDLLGQRDACLSRQDARLRDGKLGFCGSKLDLCDPCLKLHQRISGRDDVADLEQHVLGHPAPTRRDVGLN